MTIAITGATGFLGLRVLPLLMERDQVVVLAHAGSPSARDRIARHFRASGKPVDAANNLTILLTELTKPRLGLPHWQFRALAPRLTEIWHLGASIDLAGAAEQVRPVNVGGTRAVLELASIGTPMLYHVSTAFVAGRRRTGLVMEDDLDASHGFENPYEQSKHDGEQAVHEWSRDHGRPALIFRPSVLITDLPTPPGGAGNTLLTISTMVDLITRVFPTGGGGGGGDRLPLQVVAAPGAHHNLIPVELAARLMVELADRVQPIGVCTAHITYPHEVGIETMVSLIEQRYPVQVQLVAEAPPAQSPMEALTAEGLRGFISYGFSQRQYDRGALRRAGLDPSDAPPLDPEYLMASLTGGHRIDR